MCEHLHNSIKTVSVDIYIQIYLRNKVLCVGAYTMIYYDNNVQQKDTKKAAHSSAAVINSAA